jgi:hypothetical protein
MAFNTDWADTNTDVAVKAMKCHIRGYQHIAKNPGDNIAANAKWCGIDEKTIAVVFNEKRQRLTLALDPLGSQKFAEATKALGIIEKSEFQPKGLDDKYQQLALKEMGLSSLPDLGL